MEKARYLWLVCSEANPEKEEAYNDWYNEHASTFFKFPGVKRIVRNKCYQPMQNPEKCPQYVVIYEFDEKEDLEAFLKSDAMEAAKDQMKSWDGFGEFLWSGWFEPLKELKRD